MPKKPKVLRFRDLTSEQLQDVIDHIADDLHDRRVDEEFMEANGMNFQPAYRGVLRYLRSVAKKRARQGDESAE